MAGKLDKSLAPHRVVQWSVETVASSLAIPSLMFLPSLSFPSSFPSFLTPLPPFLTLCSPSSTFLTSYTSILLFLVSFTFSSSTFFAIICSSSPLSSYSPRDLLILSLSLSLSIFFSLLFYSLFMLYSLSLSHFPLLPYSPPFHVFLLLV